MPKNTSLFRTVFAIQKMCMFVVPGFILLSGTKMFLRKADNFSLAEYYASRFLRLIVPYVFWSAVYYLYFCHIGVYTFDFKDMAFRIIGGDIWAHFYFVIVLIQFELLAPLLDISLSPRQRCGTRRFCDARHRNMRPIPAVDIDNRISVNARF